MTMLRGKLILFTLFRYDPANEGIIDGKKFLSALGIEWRSAGKTRSSPVAQPEATPGMFIYSDMETKIYQFPDGYISYGQWINNSKVSMNWIFTSGVKVEGCG